MAASFCPSLRAGQAVSGNAIMTAIWLTNTAVQMPPNLRLPPPAPAARSLAWSPRVTLSAGRMPAIAAPSSVRMTA